MRYRPLALLFAALLVAPPAGAVEIDWVYIGNAGNPADAAPGTHNCGPARDLPCGSVSYNYFISKYEVTKAQYVDFLNAKAAADPLGLYDDNMGFIGISRSGASGSFTYSVPVHFSNQPVSAVSFHDAVRFANWLSNGQGDGDTETGAYTVTADGIADNTITREPAGSVFVPSEDEWYKAAYYDSASTDFFASPTGADTVSCVEPSADNGDSANCDGATGFVGTNVGAYALSASPYGTFDQGGNALEWTETASGPNRVYRGGSWSSLPAGLAAASSFNAFDPTSNELTIGFRVATLVPEPGQVLLVLTGGLVLAATRRKRRV